MEHDVLDATAVRDDVDVEGRFVLLACLRIASFGPALWLAPEQRPEAATMTLVGVRNDQREAFTWWHAAGTCSSGATAVAFTDSPLSQFRVVFTPPAAGVTRSQIACSVAADSENGGADNTTTPNRDDTDETYSGLTAGAYTCTIDIAP